jgi:D-amino-acid dehydrogenase
MRVIVLGGGLLGVASAYYLQQLGHEVTVIDRHRTPGAKARGLVESPTSTEAPPVRRTGPLWRAAFDRVRNRVHGWAGYLTGAAHRPTERIEHLVRLGAYSRESVRALGRETGVTQSSRGAGWMNIYTDAEAFAQFTRRVPRLQALGCVMHMLSPEEALRLEPSLEHLRGRLAGAAFTREGTSSDAGGFAGSTIFMCRAAGVRFLMNHTVTKLHAREGRIDHVELRNPDGERTTLRADAYVMALGNGSAAVAQDLGVPLRLRLVHEHSVQLPLKDAERAPRVLLHDECSRLRMQHITTPDGERLRVWATVRAESAAAALPDDVRLARMLADVERLLPGVADTRGAVLSTRPYVRSASGLPLIGRTRMRNLFVNVAPGATGWIHACGAGRSIARIVSGLSPEVEFAFAKG